MLIPDYETEVDFLNCEAISRTVVELLKVNRKRALSVGIHGDWGAGKSSILKMVECELKPDKNVACLWFNGWAFQGFDDAKTVLIEAIITELVRQKGTIAKVKDLGAKLIKRINWLKVAKHGSGLAFTLLTGLPSPDILESIINGLKSTASDVANLKPEEIRTRLDEAASFFKSAEDGTKIPENIHAFRDEFSELLDAAKIDQLVVLIDDLDRCLPETAIETLEAIRLFLFVPKTAFIIGADEAMIEYAVRQHFPELPVSSGPLPYSRNYLEKLIQVPFRIPALGAQETRTYVTLLLVQSIVGEDHEGFQTLLAKAKETMNRPWLGIGLSQSDVQAVDPERPDELNAAFVLAQQIGPILAEGTKGNPRQIKRFLNALLVRQVIAKARGFSDLIKQRALAKLMLAERFQPDFYEHVAAQAMADEHGKSSDLHELESVEDGREEDAKASKRKPAVRAATAPLDHLDKWLERDWLKRWLKLDPALGDIDLRPYVFVARDKRLAQAASEPGGVPALIEALCGTAIAVRSVESQIKALGDTDADTVFANLRERVLGRENFSSPPPGIEGLGILVKHHPRLQSELVALIGSIDAQKLGIWVVKGWNESITEAVPMNQLRTLMNQWATQDDNKMLKMAAAAALPSLRKGSR